MYLRSILITITIQNMYVTQLYHALFNMLTWLHFHKVIPYEKWIEDKASL